MASYVKAFYDWPEQMSALKDEEKGRLFVAILKYGETGEIPEMQGAERILFPVFKAQIDRDAGRSEAGKKAVNARWSKEKAEEPIQKNTEDTNVYEPIRTDTDVYDAYEAIPKKKEEKEKEEEEELVYAISVSPSITDNADDLIDRLTDGRTDLRDDFVAAVKLAAADMLKAPYTTVEGTRIPLAAVRQRLKMLTSEDLADVQEAVARSGTMAESGSVKYLKSCLYNAPLNTRYAKLIIPGGAT
nr:MAG TPA: hypothetical protein [Caudoviricetes sp.]